MTPDLLRIKVNSILQHHFKMTGAELKDGFVKFEPVVILRPSRQVPDLNQRTVDQNMNFNRLPEEPNFGRIQTNIQTIPTLTYAACYTLLSFISNHMA